MSAANHLYTSRARRIARARATMICLGTTALLAASQTGAQTLVQGAPAAVDASHAYDGAARVAAGDTFYDQLAPFGRWRYSSSLGWVWTPHRRVVGAGFRPYLTAGQWVHSNQGWIFASDYEWGWIPFHYGRWFHDAAYGWSWVPGSLWAPAWVEWRHGGGYVGWAPLPPSRRAIAAAHWAFCSAIDIGRPRLSRHLVPGHRAVSIYRRTAVVARRRGHWSHGPQPSLLRVGHRPPVYRRVSILHVPRRGVAARVHLRRGRASFGALGTVRLRHQPRATPAARPNRPVARPYRPAAHPRRPVARPYRPAAQPRRPVARAHRPAARAHRPAARAHRPAARPSRRPAARPSGRGGRVGSVHHPGVRPHRTSRQQPNRPHAAPAARPRPDRAGGNNNDEQRRSRRASRHR